MRQGPVVYLGLEEKRGEVLRHFRQMGMGKSPMLRFYVKPAPEQSLARLLEDIEDVRPVLVIIDPLFRFTRFKDGNDYAEATNRLEPLLAAARETNAHLLFTHHSKKSGGGVRS